MADPVSDERLWSWIDAGSPELDAHLAAHPEDAERVAALRGALNGVARHAAPPRRPLPERIGPYEVFGILGEGGMGVVYEARQANPRRAVAVKVLRAGLGATPRQYAYLRREIEALGRLQHPHIAAIYEAGEAVTGEPYLAMERVRGTTLDKHLALQGFDVNRRLDLFVTLCDAVHAAHEQGVVHRDLKPSNVMVDEDGRPKVLDFGLARLSADDPEAERSLTTTHVVGTLPYMSPEQVMARPGGVDRRTDVYALGVMLFEALAGTLPYDIAGAPLPKAARIIGETPPRIRGRARRVLRGDLRVIVETALAKDPARRYATAEAFAADLRAFREGRPIAARTPSRLYRSRKCLARHPVMATIAFFLLTFLIWGLTRPASMNLDANISGRNWWYPELSPFEAVAWKGNRPFVCVDEVWYELERIEEFNAGLVVEYAKQVTPTGWRKRFTEDLPQLLTQLGGWPGLSVDLVVREIDSEDLTRIPDVSMDGAKRRIAYADRHSWGGARHRWGDEKPEFQIDARWYELVALDGVPLESLVERARDGHISPRWWSDEFGHVHPEMSQIYGSGGGNEPTTWKAALGIMLSEPDAIIALLGHSPPNPVLLDLRDPESGQVLKDVPYLRTDARPSPDWKTVK